MCYCIYSVLPVMPQMKRVEIIRKDISPLWIKIIGVLVVFAIIYKIVTLTFLEVNPIVYVVSIAVAIAIWTGKEIVIVDLLSGQLGEGFKIAGFTYLNWTKFSGLEKIYINSTSSSETFRHLTRTIDIKHGQFKAYLKTLEGSKICIGISTDKDKMIKQLQKFNAELNTTIFDNTSGQSITVE
ncbi:MAG TPA: hypothetical protein VGK46_11400 [Saprospiraceae bacterium]